MMVWKAKDTSFTLFIPVPDALCMPAYIDTYKMTRAITSN